MVRGDLSMKHRTFVEPRVHTMGFGIGEVRGFGQTLHTVVRLGPRFNHPRRARVAEWDGQRIELHCTRFERSEMLPRVRRKRAQFVVTDTLTIFGYVAWIRGDSLYYDSNIHVPWHELGDKDVPVVYSPVSLSHILMPGSRRARYRRYTMDDEFLVGFDVTGGVMAVMDHRFRAGAVPSALQLDDFFLAGSFLKVIGRGVAKRVVGGVAGFFAKSGGKRYVEGLTRTQARQFVAQLRASGKEVVVNIGGEAAEHELARWPHALNLNPVMPGRRTDIPNLIRGTGDQIDSIFAKGSIDKVVSSKLPTSVDPERLATSIVPVLRRGGTLEISIFGAAVDRWAEGFVRGLVRAGIPKARINNIKDVLFLATR